MTTTQFFKELMNVWQRKKVTSYDFYRTIFAEGELQKTGKKKHGLYNAMLKVGDKFIYLHDELYDLPNGTNILHATFNCLAYAGESGEDRLAMELHAFVVKVYFPIWIDATSFEGFLKRHIYRRRGVPTTRIAPTFVTTSTDEQAVLFYYVLDKPIPIYNKFKKKLNSMQSHLAHAVQQGLKYACGCDDMCAPPSTGIYTRYPVVGTFVDDCPVEAYKLGDLYTLEDINNLIPKAKRLDYKPSKATLEEAKEKWPLWAQRRLVEGKDLSVKNTYKEPDEGRWNWYIDFVKKNINEAKLGAFVGLVAFAVKCHMSFKTVWDAMEDFEKLFSEKFKKSDIDWHISKAWELYEECPQQLKYFTREHIENLTGLAIPPKSKRNGLSQKEHLAKIHKKQSKKEAVKEWRKKHPQGNKKECANELGISWPTVHKWWETKTKAPRSPKEVKVPKWRLCKNPGCTGILEDCEVKTWLSKKLGMHYKQITRKCNVCGAMVKGAPRITD